MAEDFDKIYRTKSLYGLLFLIFIMYGIVVQISAHDEQENLQNIINELENKVLIIKDENKDLKTELIKLKMMVHNLVRGV